MRSDKNCIIQAYCIRGCVDVYKSYNCYAFCSKTLGREKLWSKHILADVNFHGADQFLISDKEVKRSDEYIIRVPHSALEKYVDKATYKAMPADEAYNCFTLKKVTISSKARLTAIYQILLT